MNFNSFTFIIFFAVFFTVYWAISGRKYKSQNIALLGSSFLFYGWWDWRFLFLLSATILCTYFCALKVEKGHGKSYTAVSIVFNLLVLAFFKYFNFFSLSLQRVFKLFLIEVDWFTLDVLLPVGISFYTFQAIGYTVDVYRGQIRAERNIVSFAVFLSYFPQLVAGPIERSRALLPQINRSRTWNYPDIVQGMRQALWGMLKKVVIADACGHYVDKFYSPDGTSSVVMAVFSTLVFSVQIYCDFSGYCDIACGVSKMLGIKLTQNFRYPYFAGNVQDFWRRWNISLMDWFRDYVYIPLGGSHKGVKRTCLNIFIVFVISGLWHGASWNFVAWGVYWGIVSIVYRVMRPGLPAGLTPWGVPVTVSLAVVGWAIFRSASLTQAFTAVLYCAPVLSLMALLAGSIVKICGGCAVIRNLGKRIHWISAVAFLLILFAILLDPDLLELLAHGYLFLLIGAMFILEWFNREVPYVMYNFRLPSAMRIIIYILLVTLLLVNQYEDVPFIYFQF